MGSVMPPGMTEFDWGKLTTEVKEMRHLLRNQKTTIQMLCDDMHQLRIEMSQLRVQIRTSIIVISTVVTVVFGALQLVVK